MLSNLKIAEFLLLALFLGIISLSTVFYQGFAKVVRRQMVGKMLDDTTQIYRQ